MAAILLDIVGAYLVARYIKSIWFALPLAFIAGVVSTLVVLVVKMMAFGSDYAEKFILGAAAGLVWHPIIAIIAFIILRIKKSKVRVDPVTQ